MRELDNQSADVAIGCPFEEGQSLISLLAKLALGIRGLVEGEG